MAQKELAVKPTVVVAPAPEHPHSPYVDIKGAANYLRGTVSAVRRLKAARKLPFARIGNRDVFSIADLDAYFAKVKVKAAA